MRSFHLSFTSILVGKHIVLESFFSVDLLQTAVAVGVEPDNKLPYNEYFEYFGPDYTLHVEPGPMENLNTPKDMERIRYDYLILPLLWLCRFQLFTEALHAHSLYFELGEVKLVENFRNTLLEQLSGLIHAPSVPFQHTPPVNRVLDEVNFPIIHIFSLLL